MLLFWQRLIRHAIDPTAVAQAVAQSSNMLAGNTNLVKTTAGIHPSTNRNATAEKLKASSSKKPALLEPRALQIEQILEGRNVPVIFYGKIIDQESNGLSNVHIRLNVQQPYFVPATYSTEANYQQFERVTDSNGCFSLENAKGASLTIVSVEKKGYRLSPKSENIYAYGDAPRPHHPDSHNPVIIRMWKLGEPQQLISHHLTRIGIPVDGQAIQLDLFNGKKVSSGGQLIVRLKRDPQIITPRTRYDWNLELEIPNGGLVVNDDEFIYRVPDSGYQKTFKFDMPKDAKNWTTALNQQFYIQLGNEKTFGSLVVRLSTIHNTPPLGINLDIVINPSGSRSLQP